MVERVNLSYYYLQKSHLLVEKRLKSSLDKMIIENLVDKVQRKEVVAEQYSFLSSTIAGLTLLRLKSKLTPFTL